MGYTRRKQERQNVKRREARRLEQQASFEEFVLRYRLQNPDDEKAKWSKEQWEEWSKKQMERR